MAIYTKTGDKGTTRVFDKKSGQLTSIRKDSCHIETIGNIDELNAYLGIIVTELQSEKVTEKKILEIQANLFTINSILAGSKLRFSKTKTKKLEKEIDFWEGKLPVQTNFIFYGGSKVSSLLFYARALCRRAERSLVSFAKKEKVSESALIYFNRLSDYLFILARGINYDEKIKEKMWIVNRKR
jgi:cob(I)alamin adenosyltransferase